MANPTDLAVQQRLSRLLDYLAQDPDNGHLLADVADAQMQLAQWGEAKICLDRWLSISPQDPQARYRLAVCERASDRPEVAVPLLQALVEEGHTHPAVHQELARSQAALGHWSAVTVALATLNPVLLPVEEGDAVWLLRIRAAHHQGHLDEALAEATQWIAARAEALSPRGRAAIATLYLDMERIEEAAQLMLGVEAATLNDNAELAAAAGYVALSRGHAESAHQLFARSAELQPDLGRARLGLGLAYAYLGDMPGALTALGHATQVTPEHLGTWHALGWMQLLTQDLEGAAASFQSALAQDDSFGETHGGLALVAALRGDREAAEAYLRTGARLDAQSVNVMVARTVLARGAGQLDREVLGRALQRFMGLAAARNPALVAMLSQLSPRAK